MPLGRAMKSVFCVAQRFLMDHQSMESQKGIETRLDIDFFLDVAWLAVDTDLLLRDEDARFQLGQVIQKGADDIVEMCYTARRWSEGQSGDKFTITVT
jgi:hypothetical protein